MPRALVAYRAACRSAPRGQPAVIIRRGPMELGSLLRADVLRGHREPEAAANRACPAPRTSPRRAGLKPACRTHPSLSPPCWVFRSNRGARFSGKIVGTSRQAKYCCSCPARPPKPNAPVPSLTPTGERMRRSHAGSSWRRRVLDVRLTRCHGPKLPATAGLPLRPRVKCTSGCAQEIWAPVGRTALRRPTACRVNTGPPVTGGRPTQWESGDGPSEAGAGLYAVLQAIAPTCSERSACVRHVPRLSPRPAHPRRAPSCAGPRGPERREGALMDTREREPRPLEVGHQLRQRPPS